MDVSKYLSMCETFGDTPDPEKIPPEYSDFPVYVHEGIEIFNALPDNYVGGMTTMYTGKDLSALTAMFELFQVEEHMRMRVFEIIRFLDNRARKQAVKEAQKASKARK